MPSVIERLEGTPVRISHKLQTIDHEILTSSLAGKWSILEHLGHLTDLEPLWLGRLEDILNGTEVLRAADLTNRKTMEAGHNNKSLHELLKAFELLRAETISRLIALDDEDIFRSALHPRLKTPMSIQDLYIFVAEHDDHHLAKMTSIIAARRPWISN
jgi:uncharacterized damage-inducible protein DinB